jgi:hypothetical protein
VLVFDGYGVVVGEAATETVTNAETKGEKDIRLL